MEQEKSFSNSQSVFDMLSNVASESEDFDASSKQEDSNIPNNQLADKLKTSPQPTTQSFDEALESLFSSPTPTIQNHQQPQQPTNISKVTPNSENENFKKDKIVSSPVSNNDNSNIKHDFSSIENSDDTLLAPNNIQNNLDDKSVQQNSNESPNNTQESPPQSIEEINKKSTNIDIDTDSSFSSISKNPDLPNPNPPASSESSSESATPEVSYSPEDTFNKQQANDILNNLMGTGRKADVHTYARFKKKKKNKNFFILEHSTENVDTSDTSYDLYYEDILPLDAEEVKQKDLAKKKRNKLILITVGSLLFITVGVFILIFGI